MLTQLLLTHCRLFWGLLHTERIRAFQAAVSPIR
jgi:hypothetical protein